MGCTCTDDIKRDGRWADDSLPPLPPSTQVPVVILVCGFASGVIPGLVPVEPDYSFVETASLKSVSYSDLTAGAEAAAERGGSLF